jgi:5-methyltetrahydrofolate--homocysteine methyltransferase
MSVVVEPKPLRLSGSQPFTQQRNVFIMIGERTNVAGSPRFAKLVKEGKYEEAVSIARQQIENGANVLDICMDEGMIDGVAAMSRYLQLLASEARASSTPSRSKKAKINFVRTPPRCSNTERRLW